MKKLLPIIFLTVPFWGFAQSSYEAVLQQIETNNTTLVALRQQAEVEKIGNKTGLTPDNPEVEFNYLWGAPALIGVRKDFKVLQTFDFPSAYAYRAKIAHLQNTHVEWVYKAERLNILLSAKQTCIELIYYNALARAYTLRLKNAESVAEAYRIKWEKGETNVMEHNKAQLNLSTVQAELKQIEAHSAALCATLHRLNGGKEIHFSDETYPYHIMPLDFEEWYTLAEGKNPVLLYVRLQIEINQQWVKLNRTMGLPKFSAGYMSEKVVGEHFQGITVGFTIPLWENKNRVKASQAMVRASEFALEDSRVQFYNSLKSLYNKATALQHSALQLRQSLSAYDNEPLLKKALDAGEISLLNYLLEIEYHYEAINKTLETERDFEQTLAELSAVEL